MTNGQQYTAPPPGGFPRPECVESPWRNTTDRNRADWGAQAGPKGWVRVYRAKYTANARDVVSKLLFVIPRLVEAPGVVISPPTSREDLDERLAAPWNFLISSISEEALTRLTDQCTWSTPTISFMVFPFDMPLPRYVMTLQNFSLADDIESNKYIARIIKAKLKSIKEASDFITKHSAADDTKAAENTIESIDVKSLEITITGGQTDLIWNIYCTPPKSLDFFHFLEWCTAARGLVFETDRFGTGVARMGKEQLFCVGCKSYDHPTGLCPLPRIVGWFGPSVQSVSSEDKTLQQADERNERKAPKSGRGAGKSQNGYRGGGKGGNRNTRGGRRH
ncbi:hypothetical protein DFH07DRAFT_734682 [Mycena maculata]|uniref:Uncharacterized protein n=1 Tax=Mycena maculata TaxID=230809 RepID=A0AAD7JFG6_9AGAR|nr:hypothetical protein DFH07DRAFT_738713 [Mycena maculata]KAJ7771305.1 hypothetical protein DFH07DRAFT_734682 [Mycena maculata]